MRHFQPSKLPNRFAPFFTFERCGEGRMGGAGGGIDGEIKAGRSEVEEQDHSYDV